MYIIFEYMPKANFIATIIPIVTER